MKFASTAIIALAVAAIAVAQIPPAPIELVWEGMYAPPYLTNPQIALSMDCSSSTDCYIGGGSNGIGFGVYRYNGQENAQLTRMHEPNMSFFVTDIAVGRYNNQANGVFTSIVDFTVGKGLQYLANKASEWLPSAMPWEIVWASQSVSGNQQGTTYVAVGNGFSNDLMISKDEGKSFSQIPFTYQGGPGKKCSFPGNIDVSSPNVWYMTYGNEPPRNNSNNNNVNDRYLEKNEVVVAVKHMGQILLIKNTVTGEVRRHVKTLRELQRDRVNAMAANKAAGDNDCNFYYGSILKSTDQGKTWTQMYQIENYLASYIQCYDEETCVAIAFNEQDSKVLTLSNGQWKVTYTAPPASQVEMTSVQQIGFESKTEIWIGGSQETQASGKGMFWSSKDGGNTWTAYRHFVPDVLAITAIDFADNVGFALGITMFKTAQIMRYKKQADYGDFIQSHCPIQGCTILCQNISFPQGMCLSAQGGSAKAFCTPEGVKQYMYETTSCVGSYKTALQPINQCLNGTNTFFKNYCPPSSELSKARKATARDLFKF